jgi:hypothetical protein
VESLDALPGVKAKKVIMFGSSKKEREFFRACNVYCRPESDQAIVAAVLNHGGLMHEKSGGASEVAFSDASALGRAIRYAIDCCEYGGDFDYSGSKLKDWPAFQASGYKTVKRFEADFIRLLIKGVNEKNFFYDLISPEFGEFGLHLTITVHGYPVDYGYAVQYGHAVHYLVKEYLVCKAATQVDPAPPGSV